jgi:peroxiredoxin
VAPLPPGSAAPPIPGVTFDHDPQVLFFFKVTCPVCQMAAPAAERFEGAYPGHIMGVGQDPPGKLAAFSDQYGMSFRVTADDPPYPVSSAYVVPTTFLVDPGGTVIDVVESWDREGLNGLSERLAQQIGAAYAPISAAGDGLPPFRPG